MLYAPLSLKENTCYANAAPGLILVNKKDSPDMEMISICGFRPRRCLEPSIDNPNSD
jgi:hypothetical protein